MTSPPAPRSRPPRRSGLLLAVAAAALLLAPRPAAAQSLRAPEWQVGTAWEVTRRARVSFADGDGNSGTLDVVEEFTLTVDAIVNEDGWAAWRLVRSNASLSGSGTATLAGGAQAPLQLGPLSSSTGSETVRLGDLATIVDDFTWTLQLQTVVLSTPVLVANGTLAARTTFSTPFEEFDFPIEAGETWSWSHGAHVQGQATIDFVGLLADFTDINRTFDDDIPFAQERQVEAITATTATLGSRAAPNLTVFDATLGRASSRQLPSNPAAGLESFSEEVTAVTGFPAPPAWGMSVTPSPAPSGSMVTVTLGGLPAGAPLPNVVIWTPDAARGQTPLILPTGGAATFQIDRPVPTADDATPGNSDLGSFCVVASFTGSSGLRVATYRRAAAAPPAPDGLVIR